MDQGIDFEITVFYTYHVFLPLELTVNYILVLNLVNYIQ